MDIHRTVAKHMKSTTLVLSLLFGVTLLLSGQDQRYSDSLRAVLKGTISEEEQMLIHNELAYLVHNEDSALTYQHALAALDLARRLQNEKEIGRAYKSIAQAEAYLGYNQTAIHLYDTAYHYFQIAKDSSQLAAILNNMGRQLCHVGAFERAIEGYHQAEHWARFHDEKLKLLIFNFNHAACLSAAFESEATIALCLEALTLADELDHWYIKSELYSLLGISYGDLKEFTKAEAAYTSAFAAIPKAETPNAEQGFTTTNPGMAATVFNNRGLLYLEQRQFEKAYNDFNIALELSSTDTFATSNGEYYVNIGIATKALQQWDESLSYFQEGLRRLEKAGQIVAIGETYQHLADLYYEQGNGLDAFDYLKAAHQIQDSLLSVETKKNLQELEVKYETAKFKKELSDSNLQIQQQAYRFNLLKLASLAFVLLLVWAYWFYHSKQKNRLLELQKRQVELQYGLLRAQMNPHFIFNALNAIQGFFVGQKLVQGNEFLGKFSSLIRRILDQSKQPLHSLAQELDTLRLYLDIEKERLEDQLDYTISIAPDVETAMVELPPLIFQPFVENAIWHGIAPKKEKGHIWISLEVDEKEDTLHCSIKDDGVGMKLISPTEKNEHISKGISITKERLGSRGTIQIKENEPAAGVTVNINISIQ